MDRIAPEQRSKNMAAIKGRDTKPELAVRSLLHRLGFRFRLHKKDLPGKPDIVLRKYMTVVLVHGCFWHQHMGCKKATTPSSNVDFWKTKLAGNVARDRSVVEKLEHLGWRVVTVWACELDQPDILGERLIHEIRRGDPAV